MKYTINFKKIAVYILTIMSVFFVVKCSFDSIIESINFLKHLNNSTRIEDFMFVDMKNTILTIILFFILFGFSSIIKTPNLIVRVGITLFLSLLAVEFKLFYYFNEWLSFPAEVKKLGIDESMQLMSYQPYTFFPAMLLVILIIDIIVMKKTYINKLFILLFIGFILFINTFNYIGNKLVINFRYESAKTNVALFFENKNNKTIDLCNMKGIYCFDKNKKYEYLQNNENNYNRENEIELYLNENQNKLKEGLIEIKRDKIIFIKKENIEIFITDFYISELSILNVFNEILWIIMGLATIIIGLIIGSNKNEN